MERTQKINLLKLIRAGALPKSVLNIETGVYRKTIKAGFYKHEDNGYIIEFDELKRLSEPLSLMIQASFVRDDEYPYLINVSEFGVGWIEGKHYNQLRVNSEEVAENIVKLSGI